MGTGEVTRVRDAGGRVGWGDEERGKSWLQHHLGRLRKWLKSPSVYPDAVSFSSFVRKGYLAAMGYQERSSCSTCKDYTPQTTH